MLADLILLMNKFAPGPGSWRRARLIIIAVLFKWFSAVITENQRGALHRLG